MYCNHCKKYILDTSKFYCESCGASLENSNPITAKSNNTASMDLPRKDIVNYLYIVKSLECVKAETKNRINKNLDNIASYRQPVQLPEVPLPNIQNTSAPIKPSTNYFSYIHWKLAGLSLGSAIGTFIVLMILCYIFFFFVMIFASDNDLFYSNAFNDTLFCCVVAISIGVAVIGLVLSVFILPPRDRNRDIKKYNQELDIHQKTEKENETNLKNYENACATREMKIRQIEKENELKVQQEELELNKNNKILASINSQLSSTYALNIIPSQHRTLEATVYIYDYMATSKETLADTLFHLEFKNISNYMQRINQRQLANEAILDSVNNSLSGLYCQTKDIQRAVEKVSTILSTINPFSGQ